MKDEQESITAQSSPVSRSIVGENVLPAPSLADTVISLNGRDKGKRFIVIGIEEDYSLIANGKGRRYEKPKRKKNKHLKIEGKLNDKTLEKLNEGEKVTNNELRRSLAAYTAEYESKGGM
jgi:ribosomal protein L14E/L6E/L27E